MKKLFFIFALLTFCISAKSQSTGFIENKGQWNSKVKFAANYGSSNFFLGQTGYKVALNDPADLKKIAAFLSRHATDAVANNSKVILHSHAYEVKFIGASLNATAVAEDATGSFNNYLAGNDPSKWASGCNIYHTVTCKNIYPGIDVRYYTSNNQFKYDFVVNPGADINRISLAFDGVDGLATEKENLVIKTSLGNISELKPYTYQQNTTGKTEVNAQFVVSGKEVNFKIGSYDNKKILVIDPSLIFSSFSGSTADNWGYASTYDSQGNFYLTGITFGTGFPVSNGAYQTTFGGGTINGSLSGYDIAILKLNASGTDRLYATYLGGSGNEEPHNLRVDSDNNLIITGITNSIDFPTTAANYGPGGGNDIFIAKLNSTGTALLASRKIGGTSADGLNIRSKEIAGPLSITRNYGDDGRSEVIFDNNNNICFASCTQSSNFPVSQNAFQKTLGGNQDAVIIKLSSDLSTVIFSSFFGGNGDDGAFSLALNPVNNNIYAAGSTTSNNLPGTGTDAGPILYKTFRGGTCDGFIAEITNDGNSLINMRYAGTAGNDMLYEIAIDKSGNPYLMGTTTEAFPVVNAAFNTQANGKQFITKIDSSLNQVIYSTNFGKGQSVPDISPTAFGLDDCENVYVAGWGGGINSGEGYPNAGTLGLAVTANAIRSTSDGNDFYIFVLEKNATSQLYGSFYGNIDITSAVGDHIDGGNSRFDEHGNLYLAICANCGTIGTFPTTPGVWAPSNQALTGAQCSMAAVKISFDLVSGCLLPVTLKDLTVTFADQRSVLKWKTTQEINSSYFEIEHSTTGQNFISIGRINAAGNSSVTKAYQFTDNNPPAGLHYYRLKMIDKEGRFTYSSVLTVLVNSNGKALYVYPNPAKNIVTILFNPLQQTAELVIVNSSGLVVKKIPVDAASSKKEINVQGLPAGLYIIKLNGKDSHQTVSFLKE